MLPLIPITPRTSLEESTADPITSITRRCLSEVNPAVEGPPAVGMEVARAMPVLGTPAVEVTAAVAVVGDRTELRRH